MELSPNLRFGAGRFGGVRLRLEGLSAALALLAIGVAWLAPVAAYLLALLALYAGVQSRSRFTFVAVAAFACAGAVIFASRNFVDGAVDFDNYYGVFRAICVGAPADEGLFAFGPELGLPVLYEAIAALGGCGLSIAGLSFVQGWLVSALLLGVVVKAAEGRVEPSRRALVVVGLAVLFSFFFVTQLSRQSLSSVFVLYGLLLARSRRGALVALLLGTLCHLTAPMVYLAAWALRHLKRSAIPWVLALGLVAAFTLEPVAVALLSSDLVGSFDKLQYFLQLQESSQGAASDVTTVAYLAVAAIGFRFARHRTAVESADMRMVFGLALLSACLLPLPLAATRFSLAFGSLAVGFYVFAGLSAWRPTLAKVALVLLVAARVAGFATADPRADHALWTNHPAWSVLPGYFLHTYVRQP